jgi:hypothetical protein
MQAFARMAKLTDIVERADYISNPKRQEHIVLMSPSVDWKLYHDFEEAHRKSVNKNYEGREVNFSLPNDWDALPPEELTAKVQALAVAAVSKETDLQWSVHLNKRKNNLHVHVIFSERCRVHDATKKYSQDVFLKEDGKVARFKAERAKNEDGSDKPPVHRKGDSKGGFSAKDRRYAAMTWARDVKAALEKRLRDFGVVIEERNPLHEFHQGKGGDAPLIAVKNAVIRENNMRIAAAGLSADSPTVKMLISYFKDCQTPVLHADSTTGELTVTAFASPMDSAEFMRNNPMPSITVPEAPEVTGVPNKGIGNTDVDDMDLDDIDLDDDEIDALIAAGETDAVEDMQSSARPPEPLAVPATPEEPHKPVEGSPDGQVNHDDFLALTPDEYATAQINGLIKDFPKHTVSIKFDYNANLNSHRTRYHIDKTLTETAGYMRTRLKESEQLSRKEESISKKPFKTKKDRDELYSIGDQKDRLNGFFKSNGFDASTAKGRNVIRKFIENIESIINNIRNYKPPVRGKNNTKAMSAAPIVAKAGTEEPKLQNTQTDGPSIVERFKDAKSKADEHNAGRGAQRKPRDNGLDR